MSEVRPQLLITVVHGTWPRGLFPKIARFKQWVRWLMRRKRLGPPPFWFEEGSPFLARLSTEPRDIPHKIKALPWCGANSIFIRDKIAVELAEDLSAEHAEHPQATQLIIAHSHGGNIALRALHHLKEHSVAQAANPLIVALATPFIEVQHADFGSAPSLVRAAVGLALWTPVWVLTQAFFPLNWNEFGKSWLVSGAVMLVFFGLISWWFSKKADRRRHNHVEALRTATRLGEIVSVQAQRSLIIRAIDDEASLVLAFSTIVNSFIIRAIRYVRWIIFGPISAILLSFFVIWYFNLSFEDEDMLKKQDWYEDAIKVVASALIFFLFGLLAVARSAHGRELARSPMECQINTQSTPDAKGLLETITLVSQTHVKSLRHGIYDHEDCAKTISDWARSQLCALPPRWETGVMPLGKGEIHGFSQTDFEVGSQEVSYWHKADISRDSNDVRLWG